MIGYCVLLPISNSAGDVAETLFSVCRLRDDSLCVVRRPLLNLFI